MKATTLTLLLTALMTAIGCSEKKPAGPPEDPSKAAENSKTD